ncbi:putative amidoligase enzyme-domain-containing protein [Hypomontagnella submonticulosa]|nr:putative amidoligase enzyme-domain-containing protein [Hypomontagnella submonticulosa]
MVSYCVGVEIELIAEPIRVSHPLKRRTYYKNLADALISNGARAKADQLDETYRKHSEHYDKWWITKDGSLGDPTHPLIPLEAVSPILYTQSHWEPKINVFWSALGEVFQTPESSSRCGSHIHISGYPYRQFTLPQLQQIAFGIVFFEPLVIQLLPENRKGNKYCEPNTQHSFQLLSNYGDHDDLPKVWYHIGYTYDKKALRDYMQSYWNTKKDRYVLWNFDNVVPYGSGSIEFRGGPGLRGPTKTKRWISFVIAFIHLCFKWTAYRGFERPSMRSFWRKILDAASETLVKDNLPSDWEVMAELRSGGSWEDMADDLDDYDASSIMSKSDSEYSDSGSSSGDHSDGAYSDDGY